MSSIGQDNHMTPRVLLIGDPTGHPDEGMKKICSSLVTVLCKDFGVEARFVSVTEAIRDGRKANSANILHYVAGPSYRSLLYMAWLSVRMKKARTVMSFTHPQWNFVANFLLNLFPPDYVLVQSSHWQARLKNAGVVNRLLPMSGVDLNRFSPVATDQKQSLKRKLGFPVGRILALHVGHMNVNRNIDVLQSFQYYPDIQPVILSSTSTKASGSLLDRLQNAGVIVRREFIPAVEAYYQAADCYIFPTIDTSASIQIPLSVLEAMAVNLPVITTRFGGLPDFFSSGNGLRYVNHEELSNLPTVVRSVVNGGPIRTRNKVHEFSWKNIGSQLMSIYVDLSNR